MKGKKSRTTNSDTPDDWIPETCRLPSTADPLAVESDPPKVQLPLFPEPSDDRQARLRRILKLAGGRATTGDRLVQRGRRD